MLSRLVFVDREKLEKHGFEEEWIKWLEYRIGQRGIDMHSLRIDCGEELLYEAFSWPYYKDHLQRAYSISKSFVSVAIGILEDRGMLALEDKILDWFPEYRPRGVSEWISEMTISHMLSMKTCYSSTTYKRSCDNNWVRSFFTSVPEHPPGTIFCYDTSGYHTLAALVEKLTQKKLLDFLREECLDQIGFSKEAYFLADEQGVSMGGSGLLCSLKDISLFGRLIMNYGNWDGRQLLPEPYMRKALQVNSFTGSSRDSCLQKQGYGYGFWCLPGTGFFSFGKGSQIILCLPQQNLVVSGFGDTIGDPGAMENLLEDLLFLFLRKGRLSVEGQEVSGIQTLLPGGIPGTTCPEGKYGCADSFFKTFEIDRNEHLIRIETAAGDREIRWRENGFYEGDFPVTGSRYLAVGASQPGGEYYVRVKYLTPEPASMEMEFAPIGDRSLVIRMKNTGELLHREYTGDYVCWKET